METDKKQGYYSLIQYCPDWTRLEVCNIGVALLCPEIKYFHVLMVEEDARIQSFFGKDHVIYTKTLKEHFASGLLYQGSISSLEELKAFISKMSNTSLIMTKPRSIAVEEEPETTIHNLFREIFIND